MIGTTLRLSCARELEKLNRDSSMLNLQLSLLCTLAICFLEGGFKAKVVFLRIDGVREQTRLSDFPMICNFCFWLGSGGFEAFGSSARRNKCLFSFRFFGDWNRFIFGVFCRGDVNFESNPRKISWLFDSSKRCRYWDLVDLCINLY